MRLLLIMFATACFACSSGKKTVCETYADFAVKCGGSDRDVAKLFCEEAHRTDQEDVVGIKREAACATKAKACADYKECIDGR